MRKLLLLVSLLVMLPMQAKQISESAALQNIAKFSKAEKVATVDVNNLQLAYVGATGDIDNFYIYNNAKGGFIIASADDCVPSILGYTDSGSFDANNIPDGLKYLLEEYKNEINNAISRGASIAPAEESTTKTNIDPLMSTVWNQNAPYYNLCPIYSGTRRCVTGCTATAMAQILKKHEWPEKGVGTKTYSPTINGSSQTLTVNFGETTYDWANMKDKYLPNQYTDEEASAVATLMYHCGVGSEMAYALASAAALINAAKAMVTNFNYEKTLKYTKRDYYTNAEWEDLMYNEMANGRPVLYAGYNSGGGHAFVADGYRDGLFHINWGWGGLSDGYFRLTRLDPARQGTGGSLSGYNSRQEILYNIKPAVSDDVEIGIAITTGFTPIEASVAAAADKNASFYTGYKYYTYIFHKQSVQVALGVQAENIKTGEKKYIFNTREYTLNLDRYGRSLENISVPSQELAALGDGEYRLYPAYNNVTDGQVGKIEVPVSGSRYVDMKVEGSNLTFTAENVKAPNLTGVLEGVNEVEVGKTVDFKLTLSNSGGEFSGDISSCIVNQEDRVVLNGGSTAFLVTEGGSETGSISIEIPETITPGDYFVKCLTPSGAVVNEKFSLKIKEKYVEGSIQINSVTIKDAAAVNCAEMEIDVNVGASWGDVDGKVIARISNGSNTWDIDSEDIYVKKDATQDVKIKGGFNGVVGNQYTLTIYFYSNYSKQTRQMTYGQIFTVASNVSGIDGVASDDAVEVARYDINGVRINEKVQGVNIVVYSDGSKKKQIVK